MTTQVLIIIVSAVFSVASNFITWILTKRRYNSEVDSQVINNMKESLNFYKELCDDTKERLLEVLEENKQQTSEIKDLKFKLNDLGQKVEALTEFACSTINCPKRNKNVSHKK